MQKMYSTPCSTKHVSEIPMNKIIKCVNKLCMEVGCK
jgi:hypothetical protein